MDNHKRHGPLRSQISKLGAQMGDKQIEIVLPFLKNSEVECPLISYLKESFEQRDVIYQKYI